MIDIYGNVLKTPTTVSSRLEDYFIYSALDKGLASTSEGAASVITIYSIGLVVSGIVLSKSLKHLWGTLDGIQLFYFLKYINYRWPKIIQDSLKHYSLITLM